MAMAQLQDQNPLLMSEADYLEFEAKSDTKHEFVNGKVYAMAGADDWKHVMITQSTSSSLYNQLRGKGCLVGSSDLRLKVESKKVSYRYPDIMVICGEMLFAENRTDTITNPDVIIEVLSPSTAVEDRNSKLDEYTRLESVQEYFLVSVDEPKVARFKRHESGEWLYHSVKGLDATIDVQSINCTLVLADIYDQVDFEQPKSED